MYRVPLAVLLSITLASPVLADALKVEAPWMRATAPGQKVAAGFMTLTAGSAMTLVGGSSPTCGHVELHYMKMENGVMEMREMQEIPLPAGQAVHLEPGGLHVMCIGLKKPVVAGQKVPLTLHLRGSDGKTRKHAVELQARKTRGH